MKIRKGAYYRTRPGAGNLGNLRRYSGAGCFGGGDMIDWTKPIETMDRRRVNWVADLVEVGTLIYVYPVSPDNRGDAFIVNHEGFRVDDRALFSARQEPFIRNVKVKKEGWVNLYRDKKGKVFAGGTIHESKEAAIQRKYPHETHIGVDCVEWEE